MAIKISCCQVTLGKSGNGDVRLTGLSCSCCWPEKFSRKGKSFAIIGIGRRRKVPGWCAAYMLSPPFGCMAIALNHSHSAQDRTPLGNCSKNHMLKRALILLLTLFLLSCNAASYDRHSLISSIKTYKDIPGVTQEEITAIEALKSGRQRLTYGALFGTEAFVLEDGSHAGFSSKFCALLSELFGIEFVTEIHEWDQLIRKVEAGQLDFTGELSPAEGLTQTLYMSQPIAKRLLRIFTHKDYDSLSLRANVNRLKIGFLDDAVTAEAIQKVYPVSFTRVYVENYQQAAKMIENGEIDAFIAETVADAYFTEYSFIRSMVFFPMVYKSVSLSTARPELAPIISVLDKYIVAGGFNTLIALHREGDFEHTGLKLRKALNAEELAYIAYLAERRASVPVAFEQDNYPVSFYNKNENEFQGIAVDVLTEIGKLAGIRFEAANTEHESWATVFEKLRKGEVAVVSQLLKTEERADKFLWPDDAYTSTRYAFISKINYPTLVIYQALRVKTGVVRGTAYEERYIEWFQDNENLVRFSTQNDALLALESGEIDLLMGSEYLLLAQQNYRENSGYKTNIRFDMPASSYFGININEKNLRSIISKAQDFVRIDPIAKDWESRGFDYGKRMASQRTFFQAAGLAILIPFSVVVFLLLVRNMRLGKRLKEQASRDPLTGILNRRLFLESCSAQMQKSVRTGEDSFIVIFDLDHFKAVNDNYGHQGGDMVLREIAQRVQHTVRAYDLFARYGGEEFILFLSDISRENVVNLAERIRKVICDDPVNFNDTPISVTSSFGISFAAPRNNIEKATYYADVALYRAKTAGRNRVVFFEEDAGAEDPENKA